MSITLYLGPMFAGKTSALIGHYIEGQTLAIKYSKDDRFGKRDEIPHIYTHDGLSIPCFNSPARIGLSEELPLHVSTVLIDEGQFFDNLRDACATWALRGAHVYVSALNGKSDLTPWDSVSQLIPLCDEIVHIKAKLCMHCRKNKAVFTAVRQGVEKTGDVLIGGNETYEPVCRKCWASVGGVKK